MLHLGPRRWRVTSACHALAAFTAMVLRRSHVPEDGLGGGQYQGQNAKMLGMVWYGMVWYQWYGMYVCMYVCMYVM